MRLRRFLGLGASATAGWWVACTGRSRASEWDYTDWRHEELRRFPAKEAKQGVAVDGEHFYVINNTAVGKYRKRDGAKVGEWVQPAGGRLVHLNAGLVWEGQLYAAHSTYPKVPGVNTVEVWEAGSLRHVETQELTASAGSLTWVVRDRERWLACFAFYAKDEAQSGKGPGQSEILEFDQEWRPTSARWTFPAGVVAKFGRHSASGGDFGPGGHLFVSGHDAPELYVLSRPVAGQEMRWLATVPITAQGQAFTYDPANPGTLYALLRRASEVIVSRVWQERPGA